MATPLFSQQPQRGGSGFGKGGGTVPDALIEFKAGRLFRDGETNWVRPDTRRGLCFIKRYEDGIKQFCWKERTSRADVEEELLVFPGDVYLEKVAQSKGRVYVLKFHSSSQRLFFWLQEPDSSDDAALVRKANAILGSEDEFMEENNEDVGSWLSRNDSREGEVLSHHREQSALARETSDLSHDSLPVAQVGGVPESSVRRASQEQPGDDVQGPVSRDMGSSQLDSLRQLLSSIQVPEGYSGGSAADGSSQMHLADVLTPANLREVLEDDRIRPSLFPTLPDDLPKTKQALDQVIRSPQFQQALNSLSYVLESGQMAPLVVQLGLAPEAGTSVSAFLKAIQDKLRKDKADRDASNGDDVTME
ncbi:hypothetical protein H4R22_002751 [Coemansia sp. RSA 1290]|nr:proteasome complex subunit Rpn13 ubiquitin receptor-domain-containing protein [Coemansia mojavensis]KAJ1741337.1 hypothetical protein LPJ68_002939 [Coemansia sp. RSA 1086]KAJ1749575.1 hypothetical protein LPJ79_003613 [Coemansia sp. RSA 1821]KAJ1871555.1 hypothetical protein LPJ55_003797 [Coemansia sp. RSA 990]KAJ2630317.1 hypothetical protein H4R22_002751 [Coemansia sp. RSA 1290]KAJ2646907.1 hypothetical protein IWW40_005080 [Coemansia sp. RSA 1250]KAJ2668737.1 hypothetical protein IWW42_